MSEKEMAISHIEQLPSNMTLDDIIEELSILSAITKGQEAIAQGKFVRHEDVRREFELRHRKCETTSRGL